MADVVRYAFNVDIDQVRGEIYNNYAARELGSGRLFKNIGIGALINLFLIRNPFVNEKTSLLLDHNSYISCGYYLIMRRAHCGYI